MPEMDESTQEIIGKAMAKYPRMTRDDAAGILKSQKEQRLINTTEDLKKSHPNIVFRSTEQEQEDKKKNRFFNLKEEVLSQQGETRVEF